MAISYGHSHFGFDWASAAQIELNNIPDAQQNKTGYTVLYVYQFTAQVLGTDISQWLKNVYLEEFT